MSSEILETFDAAIVGGGPAGATAATDLAAAGYKVALIDRAGRIKPCGGAIPPKAIEEFAIPDSLLVARVTSARMVSPSRRVVDMPIEGGYVGMVDREVFDEWLRGRASRVGATLIHATFENLTQTADGHSILECAVRGGGMQRIRVRAVIGADGARSAVARQCIPGARTIS